MQEQRYVMWRKLKQLIPNYARFPIVLSLAVNMFAFYVSRPITANVAHHSMACALDGIIPFVPAFISVYILAYVQWAANFIAVGRESRQVCYRMFSGQILAKFLCFLCFVIYPTATVRPDVGDGGIFHFLTRVIYYLDEPNNLFPSIHCLDSWFSLRASFCCKKMPRWYTWANLIITPMVFLSTLFTKQHVLWDVPAGILVFEIGLFAADRLHSGRWLARINAALFGIREETDIKTEIQEP